MRKITPEFCIIGVLLLFHVVALACGWFGVLPGLFLPLFCFLFWPAAVVFFFVKAAKNFSRSRPVAILNFILAILCFEGTWLSLSRQSLYGLAYYSAVEAKLKRVYGSTGQLHEIQSWAMQEVKTVKDPESEPTVILHRSEYPKWATNGRFPEPTSIHIDSYEPELNGRFVQIFWGNRLGGWSLIVGNPALPGHGEKWAAGVYFSIYRQGS